MTSSRSGDTAAHAAAFPNPFVAHAERFDRTPSPRPSRRGRAGLSRAPRRRAERRRMRCICSASCAISAARATKPKTLLARAHALAPEKAGIELTLGTVRFQAGDLDAARTHYEKALALDPNLGTAHSGLGQIALMRGDRDDAEQHFRIALRAGEDAQALVGSRLAAARTRGSRSGAAPSRPRRRSRAERSDDPARARPRVRQTRHRDVRRKGVRECAARQARSHCGAAGARVADAEGEALSRGRSRTTARLLSIAGPRIRRACWPRRRRARRRTPRRCRRRVSARRSRSIRGSRRRRVRWRGRCRGWAGTTRRSPHTTPISRSRPAITRCARRAPIF